MRIVFCYGILYPHKTSVLHKKVTFLCSTDRILNKFGDFYRLLFPKPM